MKIQIKVTKEIYKKAMMCGREFSDNIATSCAVALAIREIAPKGFVGIDELYWDYRTRVKLPVNAISMIQRFDALQWFPKERLKLPEFSFEVEFPDKLVEQIGIEQVNEILAHSETLQLA